jgi:hypothetical protein
MNIKLKIIISFENKIFILKNLYIYIYNNITKKKYIYFSKINGKKKKMYLFIYLFFFLIKINNLDIKLVYLNLFIC